jgi:hypothetical protein
MGKVKGRWRWCPERKELVAVAVDSRPRPSGTLIVPDLPDDVSPVTGLVVSGRKQRREDLKRTGSRPWEGLAAERQESARIAAEADRAYDRRLTESVRETFHQLPPSKRRILEGR